MAAPSTASLLLIVLGCLVHARAQTADASHHPPATTVLFSDSFAAPPDPLSPDSPYTFAFMADPPTANVVFSAAPNGGGAVQSILPFVETRGLTADGQGVLDHVKSLVLRKEPFSADGRVLRYGLLAAAEMVGNADQPFPASLVKKANLDVRLGMCGMVGVDLNTNVVTDFQVTNKGVYALYERLPFARTADSNYAAFTQVKLVSTRKPKDLHNLTIEYNPTAGTLSWLLGGNTVLFVDKIGFRSTDPKIVTLVDRGGVDTLVPSFTPSIGFGCFTLLDAVDPNNAKSAVGLVRLAPSGYDTPASFYDEAAQLSNRLWGQGATMTLKRFKVERR